MLVRIIGKANPAILDAREKLGPLRRHLDWQRLIDVIHEIGGGANNKMGRVSTNIMKQLKAHIAAIGNVRHTGFQHLAQYLAFGGIGLGVEKLGRYHPVEFER